MDRDIFEMLIPLTAVVLGSLMFLIPIAGLTARFALKPFIDSVGRAREAQSGAAPRQLEALEQRIAQLEQLQQGLESSLEQLIELKEFERRLAVPPPVGQAGTAGL